MSKDIAKMASSFTDPKIKAELDNLKSINPAEKSMEAILDLFQRQVYRGGELAKVRDSALYKLNELVETDQLSAKELIDTVKVTAEMEIQTAKSVFDLAKPGDNGVNIFMGSNLNNDSYPYALANSGKQKPGADTALENKKMAVFTAFMEAIGDSLEKGEESHKEDT